MASEASLESEPTTVYESVDVDSESDNTPTIEPENEYIERSIVTRDSALEAFAEPARRVDDTVSTRVARIRRDIEDLRRSGAEIEALELANELKRSIEPRVSQKPTVNDAALLARPVSSEHSIECGPEFAALEGRVAKLEAKFGLSLRSARSPESLASSVAQLRQTVELLASSPETVTALVEKLGASATKKLREPEPRSSRIDALYYRLESLDEAIDALPQVVSRLKTLRYFHTESLNQHEQLKDIRVTMESMQAELRSWHDLLRSLEDLVPKYIEISKRNIEKLKR